jgi:hypothetical protein
VSRAIRFERLSSFLSRKALSSCGTGTDALCRTRSGFRPRPP